MPGFAGRAGWGGDGCVRETSRSGHVRVLIGDVFGPKLPASAASTANRPRHGGTIRSEASERARGRAVRRGRPPPAARARPQPSRIESWIARGPPAPPLPRRLRVGPRRAGAEGAARCRAPACRPRRGTRRPQRSVVAGAPRAPAGADPHRRPGQDRRHARTCGSAIRGGHRRHLHAGLPVVPLPRALLAATADLSHDALRLVLARAEFKRILHLPSLQAALGEGRPGTRSIRAAMDAHLPQLARCANGFERDFVLLCEPSGSRSPSRTCGSAATGPTCSGATIA